MMEVQALAGQKRECRLLHHPAFLSQYQSDTIYNKGGNICEQSGNEPAPCKADQRLSANENPGALAGATGAETSQEDIRLPVCLSAHIAARHPILSLHWGIVA